MRAIAQIAPVLQVCAPVSAEFPDDSGHVARECDAGQLFMFAVDFAERVPSAFN